MTSTFGDFGLRPELVRAVTELGYETPTPIQENAIPALLAGRDVLGQAQTGTGKTAAFALPMLTQIDLSRRVVQGLVLAPTRELALQVAEAVEQYGQHLGLRVLAIYGGSSYGRQIKRLESGVHVVVGTPGRMIDLIERGSLALSNVSYLVIDEADEMLKMGFVDDVERILAETPAGRQTALFSATFPDQIRRLSEKYMRDPMNVAIAQKTLTVPLVEQRYYLVEEHSKVAALARLLEMEAIDSALVFTRTKIGSTQLAEALIARGYAAEAINGDLAQEARETVMRRFRNGHINVLVATDVVARGLDIQNVSHVFNFDMPYDAEDYVHRIGRTGRAGREGVAITLTTMRERRWLRTIESFTRQRINKGTLPTPEEITAQREQRFQEALNEVINATDLTRERTVVHALMEAGFDATSIAAAAVHMARAVEAQRPIEPIAEPREHIDRGRRDGGPMRRGEGRYEREPAYRGGGDRRGREGGERRARTGREEGMVRLMIDAGRDQGIQPGDVVGAIASGAGIPGRAIGAIDIHRNQTFVDVNENHVDRVLREMQQKMVRGRQITLRRAPSADERS